MLWNGKTILLISLNNDLTDCNSINYFSITLRLWGMSYPKWDLALKLSYPVHVATKNELKVDCI